MKKSLGYLIAATMMLFANPAISQVVDLAGPWFIDFPQGTGTVVLTKVPSKKAGGHPTYHGWASIPHPSSSKGYTFKVGLASVPFYVVPGNNITFTAHSGMVRFFMMNVSGSSSGVAWISATTSADKHIRAYYNVKGRAYR